MKADKLYVIVVAAGSGRRFGSDTPKQFLPLNGKPVVMHAIDAFRRAFVGATLLLVISESEHDRWRELCSRHGYDSPPIVYGGDTRSQSVANALEAAAALGAGAGTVTMVHDGARPLVNEDMISAIFSMVSHGPAVAVVPGYAPTDSLVEARRPYDSHPVSRADYRCVQTPQAFRSELLAAAYARAAADNFEGMTDEASVVARYAGAPVFVIDGSPDNIKITRPADIEIARILLSHPTPYMAPGAF